MGLADEEDAFGTLQLGPILQGDILLALPFGEGDQRQLVPAGKVLHAGDERFGHGVHERRRGERMPATVAEKGSDLTFAR